MPDVDHKETETQYETDCRHDSSTNAKTMHKRKVKTTTTYYKDGTKRVDTERGDWYSTGVPC